jgi:hypothetical protein
MNPEFVDHPVRQGFVVVDAVHNRRVPFVANGPVEREPADPGEFRFPVTNATAIAASRLSLPYRTGGFVRTPDGDMLAELDHRIDETFPADSYLVEVDAPIKLYLRVDGEFRVETTDDRTRFHFADGATVRVGARSYHERPTGTITVTEDPRDVMDTVSLLSSSLKSLSPERSFPTLRGHPPLVEFGDEFAVPDGVERPETGVTIELPPEPEYLLPVASLAYYLGADLVPAPSARLVTHDGFTYDLDSDRGFQTEVRRVLEQVFTLDCVTRTEGLYPIDLHERNLIADRVDLDFADLYDRSIPEQVETYLGLDYEAVADAVPNWCLVVDCRPDLAHVDCLPFVVNNLGVVRTQTFEAAEPHPELAERFAEFTRTAELTRGAAASELDSRGRTGGSSRSVVEDASFVELPSVDAINHAWVGEEWPHNANKLLKAGCENRFTRFDEEDAGTIDVTVVCNDEQMRDEYEDEQLYGDRDELRFNIETYTDTTVAELRELLTRQSDFFHYIGHVEDYEFVCDDGGLDVRELDSAGPKLFLLNGCTSFEQGRHLVEAGSVAGIVTLNDVGNESAIEIGKYIAGLLNQGFPIGAALGITQEHWITGNQYLTIGALDAGVTPPEGSYPSLNEVTKAGENFYTLSIEIHPTLRNALGGIFMPFLDSVDSFSLAPSRFPLVKGLDKDDVHEFIDSTTKPLVYEKMLSWPYDVQL